MAAGWRRSAGISAAIELPGVPLGALPAIQYEERTFDLLTGDLYVFCTDGISETVDVNDEQFGNDRIIEMIDRLHAEPTQRIVDGIFEAVVAFRGEGPQADDMTVVALKITK